jgi:site-specific DNA recombinase
MKKQVVRKLRCAVYTRKSTEEGLEQEFNSLGAQREACEAYIVSQKPEGWLLVPDRYDDAGISGATLDRPALQRLLGDIEAQRVDVVVVYKIDRLSRALMDFAKLVEVFDRNNVTFVSITQSFNTTTSMGRLTLNILLSFAQFEREVIGERIRDKFAASRKKGMWMGGFVPLGYDVNDRKLVVNDGEASIVRMIFERFTKIGSTTTLVNALRAEGITGKRGKLVDKGYLYKLLNNRVYVGEAVHKGVWKTQALALLIFYGVSTFIFVSEWLIERGARYLTHLRGDRWIKELEYLYVALGTIGVVSLLNKWDKLDPAWEKIDLVAPMLFASAIVVKLIKVRAEIGRWNELPT